MEELKNQLTPEQMEEFSNEFLGLTFKEEPEGACIFTMSIVHGSASYLPDLVDHFGETYPMMVVKQGMLGKSDIETTTFEEYKDSIHKSYSHGTFRHGPLQMVSIC